jgi:hypothetical protein
MAKSITIQKTQTLADSSNYELLRKKGLEYIEKLGSRLWTDYNIHDPGITMLEALAYALTDLGLRTSLDVKDLLALSANETADADGQYPADKRQAFFTARNILNVNPSTSDDFRKLLINIDGIKNGWLNCKKCACDGMEIYANCTKSVLQYAPINPLDHKVIVKGLYDILLEFEEEEKSGNLNSGKIKYNFSFKNGFHLANANIEMRLPSWAKLESNKAVYKNFRNPKSEITAIVVPFISGSMPVLADIPAVPEQVLDNALRKPVFAKVEITFKPDRDQPATQKLVFDGIPMNVWFRNTDERRALELPVLKTAIMDKTGSGIFPKYLEKIKRADAVIAETIQVLHNHRNLAEDYCTIKAIEVEDIAICADMEVEPSADIEAILAEAYYLIDQYMSPDIKFYSLQQLLDANKPVDEIFEGPALSNGFIDNEELSQAALRKTLYTSDVINLIMEIKGVKSLKNLVFARYDDFGRLVESQSWSMQVSTDRQPRLYIEGSKVMVYKNGLPFMADANELSDTLQIVKGRHTQPKYSVLENDLPVPHGSYYEIESYFSVQNTMPLTYGVGADGLPDSATDLRKAQAKQLKAYLLFFEQLLVNYLAQLANTKELFAVDKTVKQTYFSRLLDSGEIDGIAGLYNGLDTATLQGLIENEDTFLERRNKFLDHLLARFAETFNDYALMLYSYTEDKDIADSQLINNKISFLQNFPELSRNRGKSFNYKNPGLVCNSQNVAGLVTRIKLLLGYQPSYSDYVEIYEEKDTDGKFYERRWRLVDETKKIQLSSSTRYVDDSARLAEQKVWTELDRVIQFITSPGHFTIHKAKTWVLNLVNETGEVIATRKQNFKTKAEAETAREEIIAFAKKTVSREQIFIVEHVLLRPRNVGDTLLSVCLDPGCSDCDESDPYSFRITVVLNGEDGLANKGIEFRRFAEQTIRMETPAHLGLKICWVSKKSLKEFGDLYCSWLSELSKPEPDATTLHNRLGALIEVFTNLNNVYPKATLHDCVDGNDSNRVLLGYTSIISDEELDEQIKKKKES